MIIAVTLLSSISGYSQDIRIKAGLNLSNVSISDPYSFGLTTKMNPGMHLGASIDIPLSKLFSIESGVIFNTKGYRMDETYGAGFSLESFKAKVHLLYVDVPLLAKATVDLGKVRLFGTLGPYLGVGLVGAYRISVSSFGYTETDEDIVSFSDENLKRLDYGASAGLGVELKAFSLGVIYNYGLANISEDAFSTLKNRVLSVSLGYRFGSKKNKE